MDIVLNMRFPEAVATAVTRQEFACCTESSEFERRKESYDWVQEFQGQAEQSTSVSISRRGCEQLCVSISISLRNPFQSG